MQIQDRLRENKGEKAEYCFPVKQFKNHQHVFLRETEPQLTNAMDFA